jgi:hypothetical protein
MEEIHFNIRVDAEAAKGLYRILKDAKSGLERRALIEQQSVSEMALY